MKHLTEHEVQARLPELLDEVGDGAIVITRDGKPVGVLCSWPEDADMELAGSQEFWDVIEARRAGKTVPWEEAKKGLDLS